MRDYKLFFKRVLFTEAEVVSALKNKKLKIAKICINKVDTRRNYSYSAVNHPVIRYQVKFLDLNEHALNSGSYKKIIVDSIDEAIYKIIVSNYDYFAIPSLFKNFHFMRKWSSDIFYYENSAVSHPYITGVFKTSNRDSFEALIDRKKKVIYTDTFKNATNERISALKKSINPIFRQLEDYSNFKFALFTVLENERDAILSIPKTSKNLKDLDIWFFKFINARNEGF